MKEKLAFYGGDKVRKTKMPSRQAMGNLEFASARVIQIAITATITSVSQPATSQ